MKEKSMEAGKPLEIMEVNLEGPKAGEPSAADSYSFKRFWTFRVSQAFIPL